VSHLKSEITMEQRPSRLTRSEAILAVSDVVATTRYYRDVLGFADEWTWGEPPDFGGVRWGKVGVMLMTHFISWDHASRG
jgi:hypothetical protein